MNNYALLMWKMLIDKIEYNWFVLSYALFSLRRIFINFKNMKVIFDIEKKIVSAEWDKEEINEFIEILKDNEILKY